MFAGSLLSAMSRLNRNAPMVAATFLERALEMELDVLGFGVVAAVGSSNLKGDQFNFPELTVSEERFREILGICEEDFIWLRQKRLVPPNCDVEGSFWRLSDVIVACEIIATKTRLQQYLAKHKRSSGEA